MCTGAVCLSVPSKNITRASKNISISVLRRSAGDTLAPGFFFSFSFLLRRPTPTLQQHEVSDPSTPELPYSLFYDPSSHFFPPKSSFFVNSNSFFFFFPLTKIPLSLCALKIAVVCAPAISAIVDDPGCLTHRW